MIADEIQFPNDVGKPPRTDYDTDFHLDNSSREPKELDDSSPRKEHLVTGGLYRGVIRR